MASVAPLIASLARQYGLDPSAVLAVARGEGGLVNRPGLADIGDQAGGGSYGPFQLYARGALPRRLVGNRQAADSWAWSPEGIRYALNLMSKSGARGLRGPEAVRAIITRFERPANPQKSIALALGRLGSTTAPMTGAEGGAISARQPTLAGSNVARLTALRGTMDQGPLEMLRALRMAGPRTPPGGPVSPSQPPQALSGRFSPEELFYDPLGAYKHGKRIAPIGGHGSHTHVAEDNPAEMLRIIQLAKRLGLATRENPWVDPVDPVHTKTSYHYRAQPFRGRQMGRGLDVSGKRKALQQFFRALAPR